jgi:Ser/Thr protein kinase RdoA (MazF antagonist)
VSVTFTHCAGIIAAVPDDDRLQSLLRDQWHLVPTEITEISAGVLSHAWEISAGSVRYVARLVDASGRQPLEAGLAAANHVRGYGVEAGRPVRTLNGALTAELPGGGCATRKPRGVLAVLRRVPGRTLVGGDPVDQQFWGDRLGAMHTVLQGFHHPGLRPWSLLDPDAAHLSAEPWLRPAIADAINATTRLTVTDRLTYGVLHGDPAPSDFVVDPATGRAGVLDCGASGTGPLVYDVAAAVVYAGGLERSAELLDGYLAASPVDRDELHAALPVLLRFRWAVQADRWARAHDRVGLARARAALASLAR